MAISPAPSADASWLIVEIAAMSDSSLSGDGLKRYGLVGPWILETALRQNAT